MKVRRLFSVTVIAVTLLFSAEGLYSAPVVVTSQQTTSKKQTEFVYVCPMHPDVQYKKPGKCPKCKMTLEKKQVQPPATAPNQ
jgi:hypothetical protein